MLTLTLVVQTIRVKPQTSNPIKFLKSDLGLYFSRLLTRWYAQDFDESVMLVDDHLTKDVAKETLLQPGDSGLWQSKILNPTFFLTFIHHQADIATSLINYGPYIDNMFALRIFAHTLCIQLAKIISLKLPTIISQETLMTEYNQLPNDIYSNTVLLIRQIIKQHSNFDHAWNHINDHSNVANDTRMRQNEEFFYHFQCFKPNRSKM